MRISEPISNIRIGWIEGGHVRTSRCEIRCFGLLERRVFLSNECWRFHSDPYNLVAEGESEWLVFLLCVELGSVDFYSFLYAYHACLLTLAKRFPTIPVSDRRSTACEAAG
jgi:hypothetical protein